MQDRRAGVQLRHARQEEHGQARGAAKFPVNVKGQRCSSSQFSAKAATKTGGVVAVAGATLYSAAISAPWREPLVERLLERQSPVIAQWKAILRRLACCYAVAVGSSATGVYKYKETLSKHRLSAVVSALAMDGTSVPTRPVHRRSATAKARRSERLALRRADPVRAIQPEVNTTVEALFSSVDRRLSNLETHPAPCAVERFRSLWERVHWLEARVDELLRVAPVVQERLSPADSMPSASAPLLSARGDPGGVAAEPTCSPSGEPAAADGRFDASAGDSVPHGFDPPSHENTARCDRFYIGEARGDPGGSHSGARSPSGEPRLERSARGDPGGSHSGTRW